MRPVLLTLSHVHRSGYKLYVRVILFCCLLPHVTILNRFMDSNVSVIMRKQVINICLSQYESN